MECAPERKTHIKAKYSEFLNMTITACSRDLFYQFDGFPRRPLAVKNQVVTFVHT